MALRNLARNGALFTTRHPEGARWRRDGRRPVQAFFIAALAALVVLLAATGCGGSPPETRPQEEVLVERALRAALGGERAEFVGLVAPSFLAQVRAEMPDTDDETLGRVLIAGFLEDVPFMGIIAAEYDIEAEGDRAAVYVWGSFVDAGGAEMSISEADALRIPLIREDGRWYLDLLDL